MAALRRLLESALLGTTLACGGVPGDEPAGADRSPRPNIILIVLDTTRADHLSTHGARNRTTPNLERLAEASVVYRRAHSVAPWTVPSHMSMFTGLYPGEHTATWAAFDALDEERTGRLASALFTFEEGERLLARRLQQAGYTTLGVSSNPWISGDSAFAEGFDWFCDTWPVIRNRQKWYARFPDSVKTSSAVDLGRAGRNLLEFRRHFATQEVQQPFFAFFNFVDPHFPYRPPGSFRFQFGGDPDVLEASIASEVVDLERRLLAGEHLVDVAQLAPFYDAELYYTDLILGYLFDWLEREGLDDSTMIVVTADHGEHLGEEGRFSHQLSVEEELLHVPLMIRYPDRAGAGSVEDHPLVSNMDVYQTILARAGAAPMSFSRPSRSSDLARMEDFDREQLLAENYYSEAYLGELTRAAASFDPAPHRIVRRALYTGQNKYLFHGTTPLPSGRALDEGEHEQVGAWLRQYVSEVEGLQLIRFEGAPDDPQRLESLRSLGYAGDE